MEQRPYHERIHQELLEGLMAEGIELPEMLVAWDRDIAPLLQAHGNAWGWTSGGLLSRLGGERWISMAPPDEHRFTACCCFKYDERRALWYPAWRDEFPQCPLAGYPPQPLEGAR